METTPNITQKQNDYSHYTTQNGQGNLNHLLPKDNTVEIIKKTEEEINNSIKSGKDVESGILKELADAAENIGIQTENGIGIGFKFKF